MLQAARRRTSQMVAAMSSADSAGSQLAIWAGIALLCLLADNSVRCLAFTVVLFAAAYSLGAHASFRRAVAGLVLTVPIVAVISQGRAGADLLPR